MNVLEFIATMWGITCATALIQSAVTKSHVRQLRELEQQGQLDAPVIDALQQRADRLRDKS